jgi:hypothetical protein
MLRGRREARERALMHLQAGNLAAAEECYQRSVDITPRMAKQFIEVRESCDLFRRQANSLLLGQNAVDVSQSSRH